MSQSEQDIELTRRCAEAMCLKYRITHDERGRSAPLTYVRLLDVQGYPDETEVYSPLTNDAQAMALVRRFGLNIGQTTRGVKVFTTPLKGGFHEADDANLSRAIVKCVAKIAGRNGDR